MLELLSVFWSIFLAELGDKTQIATLVFAARPGAVPWQIFLAAAAALIASSGLAVFVGRRAGELLERLPLDLLAGAAFVAIGLWLIAGYLRAA